jgi:hypothetical protein
MPRNPLDQFFGEIFHGHIEPSTVSTYQNKAMKTQFISDAQQGPHKTVDGGSCSPQATQLYFRLPRPGTRDPMFGLSRSSWNNLILRCKANGFRPPIRSFSTNNERRGTRLIVVESAIEYFEKLESEQTTRDTDQHQLEFLEVSRHVA